MDTQGRCYVWDMFSAKEVKQTQITRRRGGCIGVVQEDPGSTSTGEDSMIVVLLDEAQSWVAQREVRGLSVATVCFHITRNLETMHD